MERLEPSNLLTSKMVWISISILLFASILTSVKPSPILLLNNRISTLEKNTNYASINSHNFYLIFTYKQLVAFTKVSIIVTLFIYVTTILDLNTLYLDIWFMLAKDTSAIKYLAYLKNYWLANFSGLFFKKKNITIYHIEYEDRP